MSYYTYPDKPFPRFIDDIKEDTNVGGDDHTYLHAGATKGVDRKAYIEAIYPDLKRYLGLQELMYFISKQLHVVDPTGKKLFVVNFKRNVTNLDKLLKNIVIVNVYLADVLYLQGGYSANNALAYAFHVNKGFIEKCINEYIDKSGLGSLIHALRNGFVIKAD